MGTPDFAVESLKKLVDNKKNIVGVITAPDKPAGRGQKISKSAVKKYAEAHSLKVYQPQNLKSAEFTAQLRDLSADLQIVVAFRMLPETVWNMPTLGTFNLHASLLPKYRGAAPINWAIMNGEKETGVTTFFLRHQIDTGAILFQEKLNIGPDETAGELHYRLMSLGSELVLKTLIAIELDNIQTTEQSEISKNLDELPQAPKIFKNDCKVNWNESLDKVYDFIRGLSPYPTAWSELINKESAEVINFKIFHCIKKTDENISFTKQNRLKVDKSEAKIFFKNGSIQLFEIQLAGKKRMHIKDLLNGFDLTQYNLVMS